MKTLYRCCGFENDSFERPILEERIAENQQKQEQEQKSLTFWASDTVLINNNQIEYQATIIYTEKVMSFLEGDTHHMYARLHNPLAYHDFLKKGSQLISIHPKGVYEKCFVVTILYEQKEDAQENAGKKDKIKEILVKNESSISSRMIYSINLEKIDSILINEYKVQQL
uniref:Uncharacterized protein n=1 Tax=viral metagenome TaxID=1070528 RepID=A0A6C0B9L5_9ZZZZ